MYRDLSPTPVTFLDPRFDHSPITGFTRIGEVAWQTNALIDDAIRMAEENDAGVRFLPERAMFLLHMFLENPWHCWAVLTCPKVGSARRELPAFTPWRETVLDSLRYRAWTGIAAALREEGIQHPSPTPRRAWSPTDLWPRVEASTHALRSLLRGLATSATSARSFPMESDHPAWQELRSVVHGHLETLPEVLAVHAALPIELVDNTYGSPLLGRRSCQGAGPGPMSDFFRQPLSQTMYDSAIVALEDLLMDEERFTRFLDGEDLWRP